MTHWWWCGVWGTKKPVGRQMFQCFFFLFQGTFSLIVEAWHENSLGQQRSGEYSFFSNLSLITLYNLRGWLDRESCWSCKHLEVGNITVLRPRSADIFSMKARATPQITKRLLTSYKNHQFSLFQVAHKSKQVWEKRNWYTPCGLFTSGALLPYHERYISGRVLTSIIPAALSI